MVEEKTCSWAHFRLFPQNRRLVHDAESSSRPNTRVESHVSFFYYLSKLKTLTSINYETITVAKIISPKLPPNPLGTTKNLPNRRYLSRLGAVEADVVAE